MYEKFSLPEMSRGWTCLRAGLVSGAWNYCFIKKAEKERLRRSKNILGPDLSKHFWPGLVSGPDLSKNLGAGSVQKLQGRKCLEAESVQKFGARNVSRPDLVRGWKCLRAKFFPLISNRFSYSPKIQAFPFNLHQVLA